MTKTIRIETNPAYDVCVGEGILSGIGRHARTVFGESANRVLIVTDDHVAPLYGKTVQDAFAAEGYEASIYVIPSGETHKTITTYAGILGALADAGLTRSDVLAALGGGVVGDMAGFAAATYLRGIPFIQIPTTFLAAADASVGGKVAIDLPAGKNLAGTFYQPAFVWCDVETFDTLPEEVYLDGMAETIKHAVIADADFFQMITDTKTMPDRVDMVARDVEIKSRFVAEDTYDRGRRQILNFGHTIGHAIEKVYDFTISHGKAVAIGMVMEARAAYRLGIAKEDTSGALSEALQHAGLPVSLNDEDQGVDREALFEAMTHDKKRAGDEIAIVYPERIGEAKLYQYPVAELRRYLEEAMQG